METTVEQTEIVAEMPQPKAKRAPKAKSAQKARRAPKAKSMGTSKPRVAKLPKPPRSKRRRR